MGSLLTETLLSNATDTAPPIRRRQALWGWCATQEKRAELNARWQNRKDARKRVCSAQNDRGIRQALKATTKQLKRTRAEAVQRFFENYVSQLEGSFRESDQFVFYKHLKGMDVEGKNTFTSQYTSTTRKVEWCRIMLSSACGGAGGFTNCSTPSRRPLIRALGTSLSSGLCSDHLSGYEVQEAIRALAN